MSSLKNKLLILFLSFLPTALSWAAKPQFLIEEVSVLEEFRGQLRSKFEELAQNYIVTRSQDRIVWTSSSKINCSGEMKSPYAPLASISLLKGSKAYRIEVRDCFQKVILRENFELDKDVSFTLNEYLSGKIPTQNILRYTLVDSQGIILFEWKKLKEISILYFLQKKVLEITKNSNFWQYKASGYSASYKNNGYAIGLTMEFPDVRLSVEWDDDDVRVYDDDFRLISINTFLTSYSHAFQSATLSYLAGIVKNSMKTLPSTEFVSSGAQNSRFLNEMRLAYTRLLNNLELNLVKQFVQEVVKALESGLIKVTDNRPEN